MNVFIDRYLGRARAAEHLVEDWKNKHDQAMVAMDVEELVRECVDLAALCRHTSSAFWQLFRRDPNSDTVDQAGNAMRAALEKTLEVFHSVEELVARASSQGCVIAGSEELERNENEIHKISAKVNSIFPPAFDEEQAKEAIAAFHRGEYVTIEELLSEAQSGNLRDDQPRD
ncbi:MAG: hypothetical protein FJ303_09215 [Planctomycetes bacterium]|nr:hypothetical protein [Planctomycetota bacterium]